MSKSLRTATGPSLAMLVACLGACAPDANDGVDPMVAALMPTHPTETVVIQGETYEYECPLFPCPVTDLIKGQVDGGQWFVMPARTGEPVSIYLYRSETLIRLRPVESSPPPPPPYIKLEPELTGPDVIMGTRLTPDGQLACVKVGLTLVLPDQREWLFAGGAVRLLLSDGSEVNRPLYETDWDHLQAGVQEIFPGPGTSTYDVLFTVRVWDADSDLHVMQHSVRCEDPEPPPPPPPEPMDPDLTGPLAVKGAEMPDVGLECKDVGLTLESPDEGPWAFQGGRLVLTYLRWGADRREWIVLDRPPTEIQIGQDRWDQLMNGTFIIRAKSQSVAYYATFEAVMRRVVDTVVYDREVDHRLVCAGPDIWQMLYAPR